MIECKNNLPTAGLTQDIADYLPARVSISIIEKDTSNRQQVAFKGALRVFNSSNSMNTNIADNFNFKTPLSNFSYSSSYGGAQQTASLAVNVFSVPANGAIVSFIYQQSVVSKVLSYNRVDSVLNGSISGYNELPSSSTSTNFAWSTVNASYVPLKDGVRPAINPNSTRYYLDSQNSGIFIDISNSATLSANQMGKLRVDRSVEWVLTRTVSGGQADIVGRGLMSKNSFSNVSNAQTYYIYENLASKGSGYLHLINTNLNNLCTRCILQSLQTSPLIVNGPQNKNNWVIGTKGDQIKLQLVRMNPVSGLVLDTANTNSNIVKQLNLPENLSVSNSTIDLGYLLSNSNLTYANSFINFTLIPIRGFGFNTSAAVGSLDVSQSMFSILVQPDNYALVQNLKSNSVGGVKGQQITGSNVLFCKESNVKTIYLNDFSLLFEKASLAYAYLNATSPTLSTKQFVQIGTFTHNGYGQIQYYVKNFTSNYNTPLESLTVPKTAGQMPLFGDSTKPAWQVDNVLPTESPTRTVQILYDQKAASNAGKYYFNLDEAANPLNPRDRVYFRGTGVESLPYNLSNKTSLLLYTGLRPVVLNVLDVNNGRIEDVIQAASKFTWDPTILNGSINNNNIFQTLATSNNILTNLPLSNLREQSYQVVLTNESASNSGSSFIFRSNKYTLQAAFFNIYDVNNMPNRIFLGAYANAASLFNTLRLHVQRQSGINSTWPGLQTIMLNPVENPQKSDDQIIQGAIDNLKYTENAGSLLINSGSAAFRVSHPQNGALFTISVNALLGEFKAGDGQGFQVDILPSKMTIYTAMDINNNGEIDVSAAQNVDHRINGKASTFGLQTMFSELNFKLPLGPTQYMKPAVLSQWSLDRQFKSIPGAPFDIKLNNMWAVGYNLDCFFTIQNSAAAQFDVITISTKATTKPDGTVVNALEANASTAPLIIPSANEWARSLMYGEGVADPIGSDNYGSRSGLTFKLKSGTTNVAAGDVVRLYVDNTIASNTLEWRVSVANTSAKTYQLYAYDQDRYAALLDEQMAITNKFTNEA